jgi:hypothetical protein
LYRKLQHNSNNNGITDVSAFLSGKNQLDMDKPGMSLFRIGDALSSRNVAAAMFDALRLCHRL